MNKPVSRAVLPLTSRYPSWAVRRGLIGMFLLLLAGKMGAVPLLEEGFNYPAGSYLAADAPWQGASGAALEVVSNNVSLPTVRAVVPPGNQVQLGGVAILTAVRNFSPTPIFNVPGDSVYCSLLINCSVAPTNSQNILSILTSGDSTINGGDDPLALYAISRAGGYSFSIAHHGEGATAARTLAVNSTHLIVVKYTFGGTDQCSLYLDPTPGNPEPAPDAITENDEGDSFPNLQVVGLRTPAYASFSLDTLRVGTSWADVTPAPNVLELTGPQNQSACAGSTATFSVSIVGTPQFSFQWRTNGVSIPGATTNSYTLANLGPPDALNSYDVVVQDAFGTRTSSVAHVMVSSLAPHVTSPPVNQIVTAGANATFTVSANGDQPLSFQWRVNGTPIPEATNGTYTLINPTPADALNSYDVVVSNPCGAETSSPPVSVLFPHEFFGCSGLPGFFGGMNLITTNSEGVPMFVWSCANSNLPAPVWILEAQMSEQPLNDGSGKSRYSVNVNPAVSPVYYLIGTGVSPPYVPIVPVHWITTDEFGGYEIYGTNVPISPNGLLDFPSPPIPRLTGQKTPGGFQINGVGAPGETYWIRAATNLATPILWTVLASDVVPAGGLIQYTDSTSSAFPKRFYRLTFASLMPQLKLAAQNVPAGFQLSATGLAGNSYRVQAASNLTPLVIWETLAINVAAPDGSIQFTDTNTAAFPGRFYRLVWP